MFGGEAPEVDGQPERVLLRVFLHFHGQKVVLLLGATTRVTTRRNAGSSMRSPKPDACSASSRSDSVGSVGRWVVAVVDLGVDDSCGEVAVVLHQRTCELWDLAKHGRAWPRTSPRCSPSSSMR
jgi:hypothetical protein